MPDKFVLDINNFGPINKAILNINKITVIAGPNASGKTTASKLLYSFLSAISSEGEDLTNLSLIKTLSDLLRSFERTLPKDYKNLSYSLMELRFKLADDTNRENIIKVYYNAYNDIQSSNFPEKDLFLKRLDEEVKYLIDYSNEDSNVYNDVFKTLLYKEFSSNNQIKKNFNGSLIRFEGEKSGFPIHCKVKISNKGINSSINANFINFDKDNGVIYAETPFILDFKDVPFKRHHHYFEYSEVNDEPYHRNALYEKLRDFSGVNNVFDEVTNVKTIKIQEYLSKLLEGTFQFDYNTGDFVFEQNGKKFSLANTATGLKQLGIIQILLENRKLKKNTLLIIDEPEVHLHPEWQVKLAEALVLLAKELNVLVYINSHSPYFIEAMEVFSNYYQLNNETNFYTTEPSLKNNKFDFKKVNREELFEIYQNLGNPYEKLNEIRFENDLRNGLI